ncbi:hypothetical protein, partial [Cupriavidus gilardii]|uniref:hypothetical protein n=1 Tax=Cupriavidus gilardii TaxID=82541 RepID=UPI001FCA317C
LPAVPAPPGAAAPTPPSLTRQAFPADQPMLADWLQTCAPAAVLLQRGRAAMLERLLQRPELGLCLLAQQQGTLVGCVPVQLMARLDLGGLAAMVGEAWCLPGTHESGAILASCRDWLADWCRAHGVRHLLWAPGLPGAGEPDSGLSRLPCGLWHRDLAPAAKQLA